MIPVFTRDILSEGDYLSFIFTRTFTVSGVLFFINVVDKNSVTRIFKMRIDSGKWKVISDVSKWIMDLESSHSFTALFILFIRN